MTTLTENNADHYIFLISQDVRHLKILKHILKYNSKFSSGWKSLHFLATAALSGQGCAPRGLIAPDTTVIFVLKKWESDNFSWKS